MSPLASLNHHAEEDLSVPTGWKKSRKSQTAATMSAINEESKGSGIQRGRALIVDIWAF
jgi:hypothetical protein